MAINKNKVVQNYYVLPCCLLLLNLVNSVISYKSGIIDDPFLRTAAVILLVLFGSTMTAFVVAAARFVDLDVPAWAWIALVGGIVVLLIGDLVVVHRRPHEIGIRGAAVESAVWIAIGLGFAVLLGIVAGVATVVSISPAAWREPSAGDSQQRIDELTAALAARDSFIGLVGHELRNAVAPMLLLAEQFSLGVPILAHGGKADCADQRA